MTITLTNKTSVIILLHRADISKEELKALIIDVINPGISPANDKETRMDNIPMEMLIKSSLTLSFRFSISSLCFNEIAFKESKPIIR